MTTMIRRSNTILPANSAVTTRPDFGAGYKVSALPVGAQASGAATGSDIPVRAGHGIAADDNFFFFVAGSITTMYAVASVTATQVTVVGSPLLSVSAGDILINVGASDTGGSTPNYDGGDKVVYSDMDGTTTVSDSLFTADAQGGYSYWYPGGSIWELIRDTDNTPQAYVIVDVSAEASMNALTTFASTDATPSVMLAKACKTANASSTSITDFDDAAIGQIITVMVGDAYTEIVDGTPIKLAGGTDKTFAANDVVVLVSDGTTWFEVSRSENNT